MKTLTLLLLVLTLSACSGMGYHKAGADRSDWDRDMYDCNAKNRTAHPAMALVDMQNAFDCMKFEKGWRRGND